MRRKVLIYLKSFDYILRMHWIRYFDTCKIDKTDPCAVPLNFGGKKFNQDISLKINIAFKKSYIFQQLRFPLKYGKQEQTLFSDLRQDPCKWNN